MLGTPISPDDDLDATVNADPQWVATTFCLEAGTHEVDEVVTLRTGDKLLGPEGKIVKRGPARYGVPTARITNGASLPRLIQVRGSNVELGWLEVTGAVGKYDPNKNQQSCANWGDTTDRCPMVGTGTAIALGDADGTIYAHNLEVHDNDAAGILSANGRIVNSNFYHNTLNPDWWGFEGAGIKGVDEYEVARSYIHDEQANGIWCDHGCKNVPEMANGFWAHHNLVVDNGRWGIRYEYSPRLADNLVNNGSVSALVEDNEVHHNGTQPDHSAGGLSMHDAQNGTFRNNSFGPKIIAGVSYAANEGPGIQFAWSKTRADRTDLYNGEAYANDLNGEYIQGCNTGSDPETVRCHQNVGGRAPWLHSFFIVALAATIPVLYAFYRIQR